MLGCRFHSGSHYSCPGHILYFLVRVNPYLEANYKFHDGKFDNPDREFYSFEGTYLNALKEKQEVRELIPEIYCLPELYLNLNKI